MREEWCRMDVAYRFLPLILYICVGKHIGHDTESVE